MKKMIYLFLSILIMGFIFGNSMMDAVDSNSESKIITTFVQYVLNWLGDLLREYGDAASRFTDESEEDPDTLVVRRCALTKQTLIRFAFGDRVEAISDQVKKSNFDRAIELFLAEWEPPGKNPTHKFGRATGRWFLRRECSKSGRSLGYEVIQQDDADDETDLIG